MPKKRQPQSLLTKPSSTAPATLSSARTGSSQDGERPSNVNDLLQQLRISQRTEHALPQPAIMASVHPSLRNVLDIPDSTAPRPRPDARPPQGPTRVRRIPGPPPPQSWLLQSRHALEERKFHVDNNRKLQHQCIKLPEAYLLRETSLQHLLLKALAVNWNWHAQYDHVHLVQIPLRLRETLLSYLSIFTAGDAHLSNPLQVLFPFNGGENLDFEQDESQEVRRLDLTNALGTWLSLRALRRALLVTKSTSSRTVPPSISSDPTERVIEEVPDSWEDVLDNQHHPPVRRQSMTSVAVPKSLPTSRFPNLRHLSLALDPTSPSSAVSWPIFIGIAHHFHILESLSLAYWPLPTYTPEAAATYATVSSNLLGTRRRIAYGGTNMYSALENDWRESSGILKSLSRSLYCLKWLDLTGCVSWLPALVWEDDNISSAPTHDGFGPVMLKIRTEEQPSMSVWNGNWRGVVWLGIGVGWTPAGKSDDSSLTQVTEEYSALREIVGKIAKHVRQSRLAGKGQPITIECGDAPIMQKTSL